MPCGHCFWPYMFEVQVLCTHLAFSCSTQVSYFSGRNCLPSTGGWACMPDADGLPYPGDAVLNHSMNDMLTSRAKK